MSQQPTPPLPRAGSPAEPLHPKPPTPLGEEPKRRTSELTLRLGTAALLIPAVIYLIVLGGYWWLGTIVLVALLGIREVFQLIEAKGGHPQHLFGYVAGAALPVVAYFGTESAANLLLPPVLLGAMVLQLGKVEISEALASISGTFFGVFYVGWLGSHAVLLREFHGVVGTKWGEAAVVGIQPETGIFLLLFTVAAVVGSDAGAYFAGRAYGKRKLAPRISPGKTIEGALGGVLGGTVMGLVFKAVFGWLPLDLASILSWTNAAILGGVLSIVGILGDLVESLLKRDAQLKDAGSLLPGMGGVLDRIDSSLLGIPVMYYLMLAIVFVRTA